MKTDERDVSPAGEHGGDREGPPTPKAPTTRTKLTGVELEARYDRWRDTRRTKRAERSDEDSARTLRRGLVGVVIAALVAVALVSSITTDSFQSTRSQNADRIASLRGDLESARHTDDQGDLAAQVTALVQAAAEDARTVRDAQQKYAQLFHQASTQDQANNGAPNQAMQATADHRKDLAGLFAKGSYLIDDQSAYVWQNVFPYDPDTQIDPRFAWYIRYNGWNASKPGRYTWQVKTVMPALEGGDTTEVADEARVIWMCQDEKSGQVLAWASAAYDYDGKHGVFEDLRVVVTSAGAEHQYPGPDQEQQGSGQDTADSKGGQK